MWIISFVFNCLFEIIFNLFMNFLKKKSIVWKKISVFYVMSVLVNSFILGSKLLSLYV